MLTPTLYMLQLYDRVVTGKSAETLLSLTAIVVFIYIFLFFIDFLRHKITIRIGNRFDELLNEDIFKSLFKWSMLEPSKANTQPLKDLFQIRQFLSGNVLLSIFDLPWTIVYILVLFLFHPIFGWFAVMSIVILSAIAFVNEKMTKESQEKSNALHSTQLEQSNLYLQNSEVVNSMGILSNVHTTHKQVRDEWLDSQTATNDLSTLFTSLTKYLRTFLQSIILGIGAYLVIQEELSPGMMIAGSILLGRVLAPIDILVGQWKQVIISREAINRIMKLLKDTISKDDDKTQLPEIIGNIDLKNVNMMIPNTKNMILNNINLSFKTGEITCLIGESGSGKTTLIRSILGLWGVGSGKISIDGADIEQYDMESLGKAIGYLPQDVELFDGTVSQNIACMGEVDDKLVISATQFCDTHEMILNLPNGYDTKIGKKGTILSGGQRQRIAIARTLYNIPKIVILDEPNSNLDDKGDLALVKTLQRLKSSNTTVIIVTHKMNIVKYVDNVVLLKNGQVASSLTTQEFFEQISKAKIGR